MDVKTTFLQEKPRLGFPKRGRFCVLLGQQLFAVLPQVRDVRRDGFPNDVVTHAAVSMSDHIPHPSDRTPGHPVCGGLPKLGRQTANQLSNLQETEGHGVLKLKIVFKFGEIREMFLDRRLDIKTIIPDVFDPPQVRRQHRGSSFLD